MIKSLLLNALIRISMMLKKPRPIKRDIEAAIGIEKLPPIAHMYKSGGKISPAEILVSVQARYMPMNEFSYLQLIDRYLV